CSVFKGLCRHSSDNYLSISSPSLLVNTFFHLFLFFLNFFFQFDSWKHLFVKEVPMAKKYELLISEMSYEMDTIIKKRKQVTGN
ncbi:hypothetical protein QM906_09460, partial [Streptococcus anginosus]